MNDFSPIEKLNKANRLMSRISSANIMTYFQLQLAMYLTAREQFDFNETIELLRMQYRQAGIDIEDLIRKTL